MGTCVSCCCDFCIPPKSGTFYSQIKNKIKPFDLILFRGSEPISDMIATTEKLMLKDGNWTHVGVIVTTDIIPIQNGENGKLYIWESTMAGKSGDNVKNIETDKSFFGVQIRDFEQVVNDYDSSPRSKIGWAKLLNNPIDRKDFETDESYAKRLFDLKTAINDFHIKTFGSEYNYVITSLLSATCCCGICDTITHINNNIFTCWGKCDWCDCCVSDNKNFCSQLATQIYQICGIIPSNVDPDSVAPVELIDSKEFSSPFGEPQQLIKDISSADTITVNTEKKTETKIEMIQGVEISQHV